MDTTTQAASVWMATTPRTNYAPLTQDITVDTVAQRLKELGQRVALVESGRIVEATTGNTTAKVTSLHGLIYSTLIKNFTEEGASIYGLANETAITRIEELVKKDAIDCDFTRLSAYTYAQEPSGTKR